MSTDSTKEKILAAAKILFAEKGFRIVTTRDIAREAGVSLSALSYHFKSKDQLLIQLANQFVEAQDRATYSSFSEVSSAQEFSLRFEIFIDTLISSLFKDLQLFLMFHGEIERRNPIIIANITDPSHALLPSLIKYFKQAQKKGFLASDVDVQMAAMMAFREVVHTVYIDDIEAFSPGGSLRKESYRKKWIQNLLRIVFGGILSRESGSEGHRGEKK